MTETHPDDRKKQELLPCPFCGGEVNCLKSESRINPEQTIWKVECWADDCPTNTSFDRRKEAISAWNTRTSPQTEKVEILLKALERLLLDISMSDGMRPLDNSVYFAQEALQSWSAGGEK